ncbi:hypothetical protein KV097_18650 [Mumia sp. zg.B17]|uniref:hypothetical protein n=1 Tax=Mumia sp. zg.B17 TaxID=2855446 RepID=UPI001C6EF6B4|nr:hypothetical protein [Mumia sp. zg.B17]MBW9207963.1 hypothetical protein [Mumia sp. zg.B17]
MDAFWEWLGTAGSILVGAGLGTVAGNVWIERQRGKNAAASQQRELDHARTVQLEERKHADALRREQNLFDARRELLPMLAQAREWIDFTSWRDHGDRFDSFPQSRAPELDGVGDVLWAIDHVATRHPSRMVRDTARKLHRSIDHAFGDIDAQVAVAAHEPPVTLHVYQSWVATCDELLDALNDPGHTLHLPPSDAVPAEPPQTPTRTSGNMPSGGGT